MVDEQLFLTISLLKRDIASDVIVNKKIKNFIFIFVLSSV